MAQLETEDGWADEARGIIFAVRARGLPVKRAGSNNEVKVCTPPFDKIFPLIASR